ncbi:MAG: FtsX-like permease family protein, partial [Gemmatimonadetes bacterium]|nr:FtsX-like permease family protein [Gemmatimonadota bacterium]
LERTGGRRDARDLFVVGRLRPGVTQAQATEEVAGISRALQAEHPETNAGWAVGSSPVRDALLDSEAKIVLLMLVLTVAFVMLIACANVANMLLARATVRQRELAVRAALGAQRGRLIRQLLTESLVLSLVAAALGIGIAFGLNRALVAISRGVEAIFRMATIDTRVLLFTVGVALVAPALFGLLPALKASRSDLTSGLRDGRSGGGGRANRRARGVLVSAQVALALCLMVVAGLLARTVYNSETRVQGFERQGLVAMELDLPADRYGNGEPQRIFYREALTRVAAIPTVQGAALSTVVPGVDAGSRRGMEIEGRTLGPDDPRPPVLTVTVSEGAFDVLRIPLERGRGFETRDHGQAPPVAVLSAEVARRWWPEGDALGQRIRFGTDANSPWLTIVGIVGDVLGPNAEEAVAAYVYLPFEQHPTATARVLTRSDEPPAALADPLRAAVWSVDADQPVDRIRSVATAQYERAASSYALITLFVAFALFALAMAALGIYGVMSYMVSQRRAEIGLRMALGAEAGAVHRMILAQGGRLLAGGLVVGLALALMLSRLLRSVVYGISATDPATFLAVPTVLVLVAVAANWVPAWRATRSDPVSALREE